MKVPGKRVLPAKPGLFAAVFLGCLLAFVAVSTIPLLRTVLPASLYVPLHTVIEFVSILVSFCVFAIGWYSFKQTRNRQDIIIATIYMTVGALDLVHTLSYKGMPDFLGLNTPGKAASYWLVARFFDAAALLGASFVTTNYVKRNRLWAYSGVAASIVLVASSVVLITIYEHAIGHALFTDTGLTPLKVRMEYAIVLIYTAAFVTFGVNKRWNPESTKILQMSLIINVFAELAFTRYTSPYDGANLLGHVFKACSNYLVLSALFVLSLQKPYEEARQNLEAYEREHELAGELQKLFLPVTDLPSKGFEIATRYEGAKGLPVGGDFYDLINMKDGRIGVVIGDVSGKGIDAAMIAITATRSIRAFVTENPEPVSVVERLNRLVCDPNTMDGGFITFFYGILDPSTGRMDYVNAGHEQPIHLSNGNALMLDSTSTVIGLSPYIEFQQAEAVLAPGDMFVLVTDGITEARTLGGMLQIEGVERLLLQTAPHGPHEVVNRMYSTIMEVGTLRDDAAMIVIKRSETAA